MKQLCARLVAGIKGVLYSIVEVARRNSSFHYTSSETEETELRGETGPQEAEAMEDGPEQPQ